MNTSSIFRVALRLGLPAVLVLGTALAQAQTVRRISQAAQPAAPSMAARTAAGSPSASGLASPSANPAGLNSPFPAGLTSGSGTPATNPNTPPADTVVDPATNVVGGVGVSGPIAVPRVIAGGAAGFTPLQIAQSFMGADTNRDGELTRGEALRLTIAPYSFEEMDNNHDGILSRSEYEDSVR